MVLPIFVNNRIVNLTEQICGPVYGLEINIFWLVLSTVVFFII